jgi:uncharacterized membrane protein YphA (DoxX/SURF4 family)
VRLPGAILQGILARSALALLRLYLGFVFMVWAWHRLEDGSAADLAQLLNQPGAGGPVWYQQFAEQVLLPRAAVVATLIAWCGLLVGCCLILGLASRLAGALAFLLALNFMLVEGSSFWTASSPYPSWAAMSIALLIGAAGRTFGLDAILAKRWPRSPFW